MQSLGEIAAELKPIYDPQVYNAVPSAEPTTLILPPEMLQSMLHGHNKSGEPILKEKFEPTLLDKSTLLNTIYDEGLYEYKPYEPKPSESLVYIYENRHTYSKMHSQTNASKLGDVLIKAHNKSQFDPLYLKYGALSLRANANMKANTPAQPSLSNIAPQNLTSYEGEITIEQLTEMAVPVVDFIREVQPHVVVGCDRGGRMFSLAVHAVWGERFDGEAFPTVDSKIHFARISKSEDMGRMHEQFGRIMKQARAQAERRGVDLDQEQLRVLFIDDWVNSGGTREITENLASVYDAQPYFAVMRGDKADVSGWDGENWAKPGWSDQPQMIGVNYTSVVREDKTFGTQEIKKVVAIRNEDSIDLRRRLHRAAKKLPKPDLVTA